MATRFAAAFRTQNSADKEAKRREKERRAQEKAQRSQAASTRMDIIDRLDLSGIAGNSLFHHDSPYDACSPHFNRNQKRAPVHAFDYSIDPLTGRPLHRNPKPSHSAAGRPGLSPLASATMRKMSDSAADLPQADAVSVATGSSSSSAVPTRAAVPALGFDARSADSAAAVGGSTFTTGDSAIDDAASVTSSVDRDIDAERAHRNMRYMGASYSGRHDVSAPNADIWGVSSEPWQDFAQPKTRRSRNAGSSTLSPNDARRRGGGAGDASEPASAASSVYDMEAVMTGRYVKGSSSSSASGRPATSSGATPGNDFSSASGSGADGAPRRSKSLLKRIKSARAHPNVPPPDDDLLELGSMSLQGNNGSSGGVAAGKRSAGYGHRYSPSTPPATAAQYNELPPAPASSNLGRNGTVRPRQAPPAVQDGGGSGSPTLASGSGGGSSSPSQDERPSRSRGPGGGGSGTNSGSGVGRSNSIFGRFGSRGKGRATSASKGSPTIAA